MRTGILAAVAGNGAAKSISTGKLPEKLRNLKRKPIFNTKLGRLVSVPKSSRSRGFDNPYEKILNTPLGK